MKKQQRITFVALAILVLGGWDWLESPDPDVADGNDAYAEGDFNAALSAYDRSQGRHGVSAEIRFDVGASLYKLALGAPDSEKATLLERAESAFREASDSPLPTLKSSAFHNLGNTMFTRERWPEAIDAYRKALIANQNNDNARYNLELALRKMKRDEQEKSGQGQGQSQPKQPGGGQKPQQGGGQGNQDDSTQAGPGPQAPQDDPGAGDPQNQPQPGAGQKGQPSPQNQPGQGQGPPQDQPQSPQNAPGSTGGQPGSGSPQDVPTRPDADGADGDAPPTKSDRDRKLDALESRSRDLRRRSLKRGGYGSGSRRNRAEKDW